MKEKNVFTQWKLVRSQRYWREKQIQEITEAVKDFQPEGDSREARIFGFAAIYFAHIAKLLEDAVEAEINKAVQHLNGLHALVGEAPVDYALSFSLGVFEAANTTGMVVAELLCRAQRALTHATALTLGEQNSIGLPLFANDSGEDLIVACAETSPAALAGMWDSVRRCRALCETYFVRAENVLQFLTPSISSYVNAVTMTTSARVFKAGAELANQPFAVAGIFDNDPAHNSQTKEIQIARALVAGSVADIINSKIQNGELWNIQFLN